MSLRVHMADHDPGDEDDGGRRMFRSIVRRLARESSPTRDVTMVRVTAPLVDLSAYRITNL